MAYKVPPQPPALTCAFGASVDSQKSNVTGDNTEYTILFETEDYDYGGDYNPATGTFTAPVTGLYLLGYTIYYTGIDLEHYYGEAKLYVNGSADTGSWNVFNPMMTAAGSNFNTGHVTSTIQVEMTAAQTAYVSLNMIGGGKTVDVAVTGTKFFGHLIAES